MVFCFVLTVHKDISEKLSRVNSALYAEVKKVIEVNKKERHIRGGMATKHKYEELNKKRGGQK